MEHLPSGTVTFLFTDIEGSTKLAQQHPDAMPAMLARHHQILRQVIQEQNGYIFQNEGDSLAVAFHSPMDALNVALTAQQMLQNEAWSPAPIKVRMGIHTGTAQLNEPSAPTIYTGYTTLATTARIMSAGHGEQILLSGATHELIRNSLPANAELVDLGEKRLKDLLHPEHIYQLNIAGLRTSFPALKTLDVSLTNLPTQLSTFIGREKQVEQIKQRLEKNRLVTLTGSGGVGKTRLSIQVASELLNEYPNGVWLVELAPITDQTLVIQTVCAVLDVTPQGNTSPMTVLTEYLRSKKLLLVVDNCEHLIDACAQFCDSLLHTCPNLRIIASSREALGIDGENAYRVPSLSLADPKGNIQIIKQAEAVQLFIERANTILPEYALTEMNAPTIAQICQRLDGVALAIELAASRVKILKVEQIAVRLDDAFRLLTGGSRTALPRQQTLRALIDWSYNLLSDEEKTALRRLSVFVGGWTLEAAETVCDNPNTLDLLTHLVDKSLVAVDLEHGDEVHYYLLETIRQYAREKLAENGESEETRAQHLDYFLKLAQKAEPEIYGARQIEWQQKIEDENENMHAALEWSLQGNIKAGQQLACTLWRFWVWGGHYNEGYGWLTKMLAVKSKEETLIRAKLLSGAGWMAGYWVGKTQAKLFIEESVALFRKLGDEVGAAFPLSTLAGLTFDEANYDRAAQLANESLEIHKRTGNRWGVREVLGGLGYRAAAQGDLQAGQKYYEESLAICREIGDTEGLGWTLYAMGKLAETQGDTPKALEYYDQALQVEKVVKSKPITLDILFRMGPALLQQGDYERGKSVFLDALELCRKMGDREAIASSLETLGWCARLQGDYPKANSFYSEGLRLKIQLDKEGNDFYIACSLVDIGFLMGVQGSPEKFARMLGVAEELFPDIIKKFIPFSRIETEQYIETVRAALGDEAYAAAYKAGQQMTLDEAVAYALKELGQ